MPAPAGGWVNECDSRSTRCDMTKSRCPHCGMKLGNSLYADACPHCHEELKHNTRPLIPAQKKDPQRVPPWPVRIFLKIVRIVES
jgi:predicted amidophosphoribosyltransferase